jgi:Flp pilus assembly protein TadD
LVLLLARTDRIADAYALASSVVASAPGDAEAIQVMADLAFRSGNPREGERALERMRALHRADPQWVARSIVVLGRHERRREALALAESWVREHPGDASALLLAARAHASLGDLAGAVARARSAVSVAPDSIPSRRLLAKLLQDAGRLEEAEAELGDLRRRAPYDVGVLMDLGIVRERRGDVQGAIALGREALGRAPGSPEVRNYLGYMLADHNRDLEEAERLILAAVAADPDNGAFVDSFGWVLFRLGRLTEARAALERAVLLTRGDPVVHEHLGDVYAALQLAELARQQYRLSLEGDERNVRVRAKLQAIR